MLKSLSVIGIDWRFWDCRPTQADREQDLNKYCDDDREDIASDWDFGRCVVWASLEPTAPVMLLVDPAYEHEVEHRQRSSDNDVLRRVTKSKEVSGL